MINKTLTIDGKQVEFRASAAVPRLYRFKFRRDILQDLDKLKKAYTDNQTAGKEFEVMDLEVFENVAYIMAKHADPNVSNTIEDWLDGFNVFSVYEVLPEIIDLWCLNEETQIESKKKLTQLSAR